MAGKGGISEHVKESDVHVSAHEEPLLGGEREGEGE